MAQSTIAPKASVITKGCLAFHVLSSKLPIVAICSLVIPGLQSGISNHLVTLLRNLVLLLGALWFVRSGHFDETCL